MVKFMYEQNVNRHTHIDRSCWHIVGSLIYM